MGYSSHSVDGRVCVCVCVCVLVAQSCPTLCDPWTVAHQALLSVGSSRLEYWKGLPCPPPGDLPDPGIELGSPALQVDALLFELPGTPKTYTKDPLVLGPLG